MGTGPNGHTQNLKMRLVCSARSTASGDQSATIPMAVVSVDGGNSGGETQVDFDWDAGWYHGYWDAKYLLQTPWVDYPNGHVPQSTRDGAGYFPLGIKLVVKSGAPYGVNLYRCEVPISYKDDIS
jgi:hypothetical protein